MAKVTEIAKVNGTAYGVAFVVCRNAEVAGLAMDLDDRDEALRLMSSAARALSDAGYDYDYCSDFRAYNGGPRTGLVDPVYYTATIDDDGELSEWAITWQNGAGKTAIPAEVSDKVDAIVEAATAAMK